MITASSHSPFNIPKDKVKINIPKELKGTKTGAFIEAAHYTDEMIGRFIKELDKKRNDEKHCYSYLWRS